MGLQCRTLVVDNIKLIVIIVLLMQLEITDDTETELFQVIINIVQVVQNTPPQFQSQNNVYSISERSRDADEIGTIIVSDNMSKI